MTASQLPAWLSLVTILGLTACAARPTMEQLEQEAMETGDWSAVEQRQVMDRRMGIVNSEGQCPDGRVLLCDKKGQKEECECVLSHTIRAR